MVLVPIWFYLINLDSPPIYPCSHSHSKRTIHILDSLLFLFLYISILISIWKQLHLRFYIFMGRQTTDHTVMGGSSIVLLQERFRQLQRAREEREKRELKLFFDPPPHPLMAPDLQQKIVFSSEAVDQETLSLGLTLCTTNKSEFQAFNRQQHPLWSANTTTLNKLHKIENYDVDTSLHL